MLYVPTKTFFNYRWWFSGRILACHAGDRGSIPSQRILKEMSRLKIQTTFLCLHVQNKNFTNLMGTPLVRKRNSCGVSLVIMKTSKQIPLCFPLHRLNMAVMRLFFGEPLLISTGKSMPMDAKSPAHTARQQLLFNLLSLTLICHVMDK